MWRTSSLLYLEDMLEGSTLEREKTFLWSTSWGHFVLSTSFCSPSLLDATNAWIPPLQIAGRDTFWPITAVLVPLCALVLQAGVWCHTAPNLPHCSHRRSLPKGCVETASPACYVLQAASRVIFGMDDSRWLLPGQSRQAGNLPLSRPRDRVFTGACASSSFFGVTSKCEAGELHPFEGRSFLNPDWWLRRSQPSVTV